jgi:hypothetical protein
MPLEVIAYTRPELKLQLGEQTYGSLKKGTIVAGDKLAVPPKTTERVLFNFTDTSRKHMYNTGRRIPIHVLDFENTDKRRIYQLIEMYLKEKIDEAAFCDDFYYSYDLELDYETLTQDECRAFHELSEITSRFSEFDEDIKNYPGVYYTKEELQKKIIETKQKLKENFEKLKNNLDEDLNA